MRPYGPASYGGGSSGGIWLLAVAVVFLAVANSPPSAARPSSDPTGGGRAARHVCPVDGAVQFSDTWGAARDGGRRRHKGVDMFAKRGTRLVAVTPGRVIRAGWNRLGGLGVTIRDASGTEYYYAHNSHNAVRAGDPVKRGQLVARVGNTGNARTTPPHVHFEVRPHGRTVNPTPYVRAWCR